MKKENLNDINKEIYDIFKKHDIKEHEMLNVYKNCFKDFENNFQVSFSIENKYLNMLRDIVWYNLEHKDEKDLSKWGSIFSHFMHVFDNDDFIEYEEVHPIINELNDIKTKLNSSNMYFVSLVGDDKLFEKQTLVSFCDKRKIKHFQNDKISSNNVVCYVYEEINGYEIEKIKLNALIDGFLSVLRTAEINQSRVGVDFI